MNLTEFRIFSIFPFLFEFSVLLVYMFKCDILK